MFIDWRKIFYFEDSISAVFFFWSLLINFPSIELRGSESNLEDFGAFFLIYGYSELNEHIFIQDFLPPDFDLDFIEMF